VCVRVVQFPLNHNYTLKSSLIKPIVESLFIFTAKAAGSLEVKNKIIKFKKGKRGAMLFPLVSK